MKKINIVATRRQDDDACGCCGCGKPCHVYYEIIGRMDLKVNEAGFAIFLCYQCYRPLMKVIETRDPSKQKGSLAHAP